MLNMNMTVLFVANKYFSRYKHFCVALKFYLTTCFEFVEKRFIVKPNVSRTDICKFTKRDKVFVLESMVAGNVIVNNPEPLSLKL